MSFILTLRKEAEFDIEEFFNYYEEIRNGLGQDFLLCVEEALDNIQRNPLHSRIIHKELRRIAIRRFPYRIFFLVQDQYIIVTAVFHARKNPKSWFSRP
jgi:toxin ParE1/3/4